MAGHAVQVSCRAPASLYVPAGQVWQLVAPKTLEREPATHCWHAVAPYVLVKKPGPQMMLDTPPPGHAQPGWQLTEALVEAGGHQMPAPQLTHVVLDVAPMVAEYLPDGQGPLSRPAPPQK